MVAHTYNPSTWVVPQEEREFQVITSCVAGSRPFGLTGIRAQKTTLRPGKEAIHLGCDLKKKKRPPITPPPATTRKAQR